MVRQPVKSSFIAAIGHDGDETLEVEFKNGKVYRHVGVPSTHFDELLAAESVGKHYNTKTRPAYGGAPFEDK